MYVAYYYFCLSHSLKILPVSFLFILFLLIQIQMLTFYNVVFVPRIR